MIAATCQQPEENATIRGDCGYFLRVRESSVFCCSAEPVHVLLIDDSRGNRARFAKPAAAAAAGNGDEVGELWGRVRLHTLDPVRPGPPGTPHQPGLAAAVFAGSSSSSISSIISIYSSNIIINSIYSNSSRFKFNRFSSFSRFSWFSRNRFNRNRFVVHH